MSDLEIFARILLALGFGAVLGLETETRVSAETRGDQAVQKEMRQRLGGVRTYTVLSLFGAISGLLFYLGFPIFAYLMFAAVLLFMLAAYVMNVQFNKAFGITTEFAILITVLIGFAASANIISLQILVVVIIILTFILSQKRGIGVLVKRIAHQELIDIVSFAIVAIVILPFLPNQDFYASSFTGLGDFLHSLSVPDALVNDVVLLNPFKLWQYVVLVSGFSLLGYFANKLIGKARGLIVAGVLGGTISSTSTIVALAGRAQKEPEDAKSLAGTALIANGFSFVPNLVIAASASFIFMQSMLGPVLGMVIVGIVLGLFIISREGKKVNSLKLEYTPFSLKPAIGFVVLLTLVRILVQIAEIYLGSSGALITTAISGLAGIDVAVISMGELVKLGQLSTEVALAGFLLANGVNFIAKIAYAYFQTRGKYTKYLAYGLCVTLVGSIVGLLLRG